MSLSRFLMLMSVAVGILPSLAAAEGRRKPSDDELHAAYCLSFLDATGPTADQLPDPSAQDAFTKNLLAQRQGVLDRLNGYLQPKLAEIDPMALQGATKQAASDVSAMRAPNPDVQACAGDAACLRDKVLNNPVVVRASGCATLAWLPK